MIIADERNYAIVEIAFDKGLCPDNCSYLHQWAERHPYGSTTATELLCDCLLLNEGSPDLAECPASAEATKLFDGEAA